MLQRESLLLERGQSGDRVRPTQLGPRHPCKPGFAPAALPSRCLVKPRNRCGSLPVNAIA